MKENAAIRAIADYDQKRGNGSHIRKATMVIFNGGRTVKFDCKMTQPEALTQAERFMRQELLREIREARELTAPTMPLVILDNIVNIAKFERATGLPVECAGNSYHDVCGTICMHKGRTAGPEVETKYRLSIAGRVS
jgi:hypothetical protein